MPKILFLCDTYPPKHGGSEQMLSAMARAAAASGHTVLVLTPSSTLPPQEEKQFDQGEPYQVLRSPLWRTLFRLGGHRIAAVSRLARLAIILHVFTRTATMAGIDAIVVGHALPLGNVASAIKRLRNIPYGVMTYGEEVSMYVRSRRMRAMLIEALNDAAVSGCLTQESRAELAALIPAAADRIQVLVPPASLPSPPPEPLQLTAHVSLASARRYFLTVARLVPRKGIDVALTAFSRITADFPDLAYLIVGTGPDLERLRVLAEQLKISDRVGFVPSPQSTASFYHSCTAFVMPNRTMPDGEREGYGIVFLEAALAGKPSIAGRSGGAPDAVLDGVTGLVVEPEDVAAVADAMRQLAQDEVLAAHLGGAGRERALQIASFGSFCTQTSRFLAAILKNDTALGTKHTR